MYDMDGIYCRIDSKVQESEMRLRNEISPKLDELEKKVVGLKPEHDVNNLFYMCSPNDLDRVVFETMGRYHFEPTYDWAHFKCRNSLGPDCLDDIYGPAWECVDGNSQERLLLMAGTGNNYCGDGVGTPICHPGRILLRSIRGAQINEILIGGEQDFHIRCEYEKDIAEISNFLEPISDDLEEEIQKDLVTNERRIVLTGVEPEIMAGYARLVTALYLCVARDRRKATDLCSIK